MKTSPWMFVFIGSFLVFLLASPACAAGPPAIEWQKVLGGSADDIPYSINQTADGGYVLVGTTVSVNSGYGNYSHENQDVLVMKLDPAGNLQWEKKFGDYADDGGISIHQTTDGGYIVVGYTGVSRYRNILVLKLDPAGNLDWQRVLGGDTEDSGSEIQQTTNGGYILVGTTASGSSSDRDVSRENRDILVMNLDSAGNLRWQKILGGTGEEDGNSIQQTSDGGYILTGYTGSSSSGDVGPNHGGSDVWVVKLDRYGNIEWQKVLGGSGPEFGQSIRQTSDGGYILIGPTSSSSSGDVGVNHGNQDFWVVKLNNAGTIQWQKVLGGNGDEEGNSIRETGDGGYILIGTTGSGSNGDVGPNHGGSDIWAVKLNNAGTIEWENALGGTGYEQGFSIQQTSDKGYVLTGQTMSSNSGDVGMNHGANDFWVVKLSPDRDVLRSTPVTTTPVPSVGQATSTYQMGFDGLSFNADGKNALDLDLKKARRSMATVAVFSDRVEIYQQAPAGVLMTFWGSNFAIQGDRITGPVKTAEFITDPVEAPLTPGMSSGSVRAGFPELTRQGVIKITLDDRPSSSLVRQFRSVLEQNSGELETVAYTFDVRKSDMPRSGSAAVILTLPELWVNQHGGFNAVRIIRVSETSGAAELIPAVYNGTDSKGIMQFKGISVNGTSVFGLVTLKVTKSAQENDPGLTVIPIQQPAISTIVGLFSWLLASLQQNPAGFIAIMVTACAAYAGRLRGMW